MATTIKPNANRKVVLTTCKSCHGGCGVKVTVEDGVPVQIEGNPDTLTSGTMCPKGLSSIQHIDNPYRLKYPMKRVGAKGEGKWKQISWDEALDFTASRLNHIQKIEGPDAVGFFASAKVTNEENYLVQKFARAAVGTNSVDHCARL